MVEGPGHVPVDQIEWNMKLCVACVTCPVLCPGTIGHGHVSATTTSPAIGATMAAYHGASMLCYVTPKEHLGLPKDDVNKAVWRIASPPTRLILLWASLEVVTTTMS